MNKTENLYLQIANHVEHQIRHDVLKTGDKLPSLRTVVSEKGVSLTTAQQAYFELESRGLIESRPQSGYYVRFKYSKFPEVPRTVQPVVSAQNISVKEMIAAVYRNTTPKDVVNFSLVCPAIELLPAAKLNKSVVHALRSSKTHCLNYEDIQGNIDLRKQIAKLCFNWGGKVRPEDIVVTAGCMGAIVMCLKAVTNTGDTVAIESPTYFGIFQLLESLGLKVIELPTDAQTGIKLDAFEKAVKKFDIKACVFIPSFCNPLGSCMPDESKKKLVEIITKHKIPLIEDDIYGELYFGKQRPKTCKTYDREGWVLQCSSISKSIAPGYRVGWCLPGRFTEEVKRVKHIHTLSTNTLVQVAIAHFLSIGRYEYHLKNLRRALHTQCMQYMQGIGTYFPENVKVSRPTGGFVLWIELPKDINSYKLYQEAMKYNISISPGQIFSSQGFYGNCIRISYGRKYDSEVEYCFKVLGELIKKMMKAK